MQDQHFNIGIIGAGVRTIAFCQYAKENSDKVRIRAIADLKIRKAEFLNNYFNLGAKVVTNFDEFVNDKEIDAIIISTPDYLHVEPAICALKADKNVYIEKPLATTLEDCNKIMQASENSASKCYLGFNMRHSPIHEKIYNLIYKDKKLGKITTIEANEWYYGGKTYFRRWNRLQKYGGGLWLTKACHDFDLITWIAGGKPQNIYAVTSLSLYNPVDDAGPRCRDCSKKNSCPDFYDINKKLDNEFEEIWRQIQLEMDQTGELAPDICLYNSDKDTFDNGMAVLSYDNDIRATYTVNVLAAKTTRQMRVVGTEGMAEGDMETGIVAFTKRHSGEVIRFDMNQETRGSHGGADQKILDDFINMCKNNTKPRSELEDGRLAIKMSLAATKSSKNNCIINL